MWVEELTTNLVIGSIKRLAENQTLCVLGILSYLIIPDLQML